MIGSHFEAKEAAPKSEWATKLLYAIPVVCIILLGAYAFIAPSNATYGVHSFGNGSAAGAGAEGFHAARRQRSMSEFAPRRASDFMSGTPPRYTLGIVADPDKASRQRPSGKGKGKEQWVSSFKTVALEVTGDEEHPSYFARFLEEHPLRSHLAEAGRAMELSDLSLFDGRLMTVDDRTGVVFEILNGTRAVPRHILMDGNGNSEKGFKGEWTTVKDGLLYVGGMGKEWTDNNGKIISTNPCFVKVIDPAWGITHEDWHARYTRVREALGFPHPGYVLHEAVRWRPSTREWLMLPRRASKESYNDALDERRATNILIIASEDFAKVRSVRIGKVEPTRGFSSFQFLPGRDDRIAAIKSEEVEGEIASYLLVFDLDGKLLMEEVPLGKVKYEGIEFLPNEYVRTLDMGKGKAGKK